MNYIESALNSNMVDVNSKLKNDATRNAEEVQKEIDKLNDLISISNEKIQRWQNAKLTADKYQKKTLSALIQGEKEILITNKLLLADEKEKQKEYLATAKAYVEASEIIKDSYRECVGNLNEDMEILDTSYDIWLQNTGKTASEADLLEKETGILNEKLKIQTDIVNNTKTAYDEMVEKYGAAHSESKALYSVLLDEVYAYNKITEAIEGINMAQQASKNDSIFAMKNYLDTYKDVLSKEGFSDEEIYKVARRVSGYDKISEQEKIEIPVKLTIDNGDVKEVAEDISLTVNTHLEADEAYKNTGSQFAQALGDGFIEKFESVAGLMLAAVESTARDAAHSMQSAVNNNTTNYTFTSTAQTIYQQIEDAKRMEEMNKARGIT